MAATMLQSSPLSSAPSSQTHLVTTFAGRTRQWKSARDLPFELQQFVQNYFEEALFTKACGFLLMTIKTDSARRDDITVPPPEYLSLLATLAVHPLNTTRTTLEEKWAEANAALRYLQLLLKLAGPINARFKEAFKFKKLYDSTVGGEEVESVVLHPYANDDSIWSRADDFWAVVGWVFNCSCLTDMYEARWKYWQSWLEFMVEVLEQDWQYHLSNQSCDQSMLWKYLGHAPSDAAQPRRVVRAIYADGSKSCLNEFREVFKRELKEPKQESDKLKRSEAVDIDKDIYGDYLKQDDSDDSSESEMRTSKRTSTRTTSARRVTSRPSRQSLRSDFEDDDAATTTDISTTQGLGPPESLSLRLRLMQLLVHVASQPDLIQSRTTNFPDPTELFTLFVEFIKPLPFAVFQQITSPSVATSGLLTLDAHTTLLEFILQRLLETPISNLVTLEPLTQSRLESEYLPFAAGKAGIDANSRVSLCVEGLLRDLMNAGVLVRSETLGEAVEQGVERRLAKVRDKRDRVRKGSDEAEALAWLIEGSARMRHVIKRLEGRRKM